MEKWHGNRLRPKEQAKEAKNERSCRVYAENQMKINSWWQNEKLLREQYNLHGTNYEEDPFVLHEMGFSFLIYTSEITLNGEEVFVMNKHGFSITKEKKIKAWKI